jgi:hypothetical protein
LLIGFQMNMKSPQRGENNRGHNFIAAT